MGAAESSQTRGARVHGQEMTAQRGIKYNRGDDTETSQSRGAPRQDRDMTTQRGIGYDRGDDITGFPKIKNSNQANVTDDMRPNKKRKAGKEVQGSGGVKKVKLGSQKKVAPLSEKDSNVSAAPRTANATMPSSGKKRKACDESGGDAAVKKVKKSKSIPPVAGGYATGKGETVDGASPAVAGHDDPDRANEYQGAAKDDGTTKTGATAGDDAANSGGSAMRKKTGFLDLPAEIRNDIYALALASGRPTNIVSNASWSHEPGLLSAHPQIRNEALPMHRKHVVYRTNSVRRALNFLRTQLPQEEYKHVKRLEIVCRTERDREERSLRAVRRALHTFKHAFGRKGLKTSVIKIQMPVHDYNNRDQYEMVWADIDNLKEFIFREGYWYKHTVRLSDVPPSNLHGNGRNTCR